MDLLFTLNFVLAAGGLALLAATMGLYVDYYFFGSKYYVRWVKEYVWHAVILTTIGSVALSLVYSEYFGFIPCSLCWLQRIALYPQALFVLVAFKIKDNIYFPLYGMVLSVFGLIVAVYHYVYQALPKEEATAGIMMPCLADGSADCAVKIMNEFGFVTFPFLSAVTFAFLMVLYLNLRRTKID